MPAIARFSELWCRLFSGPKHDWRVDRANYAAWLLDAWIDMGDEAACALDRNVTDLMRALVSAGYPMPSWVGVVERNGAWMIHRVQSDPSIIKYSKLNPSPAPMSAAVATAAASDAGASPWRQTLPASARNIVACLDWCATGDCPR